MSDEVFVLRFDDGPAQGDECVCRADSGWPPPPLLERAGLRYALERYSQFTDEQMAEMGAFVVRGALYKLAVAA